MNPEATPPDALADCSVGVLVASYRRPRELERCLRALAQQRVPPREVLVAVRDSDAATRVMLAGFGDLGEALRVVLVTAPGVVAARNAALDACRSGVVAMVDDDAVPYPDWIARIAAHFAADPRLGGLGGRDRCHDGTRFEDGQAAVVGRIQWHGRLIGNHHLGFGPVRDVDYLKGANMSFRMAAVGRRRFSARLRGSGAGPHEDMAFSIAVRRGGWRLRYDPEVLVDHFAAPREEPRHYVSVGRIDNGESFFNHAFNLTVAIWDDLSPPRRLALVAWSLLIGTGTCPGLAQALRYTPRLGRHSWRRFLIAQRGRLAACRMLLGEGRRGAAQAALGDIPERAG